ncbi:ABC transporter ATP-binding protein [Microbacterium sp. NPDC089695]|uniref:ABC transporter ATP-binding protein n=1 Tax=Microbacterium sp. NPDC089695 TaxID=3364198 RepID=UPI00380F65CA
MTASPDDRTDPASDAVTPPAKKTAARTARSGRAPAKSTPARSAAEQAAATAEVVAEPKPRAGGAATGSSSPRTASKSAQTKSAAAKSAASKSAASKSAASKSTASKSAASKSAAAKSTAAKTAAAKSTAASSAAKATAARTTAAKTAAAKAAAAKSAEATTTARTTAARSSAARTAAAKKAAATRAAKAAAAKAEAEALAAQEAEAPAAEDVEISASEPAAATEPPADQGADAVVAPADPEPAVLAETEPADAADAPDAESGTAVVVDDVEEAAVTADVADAADAAVADAPSSAPESAPAPSVVAEPVVDQTPADDRSTSGESASAVEAIRIRGLVKTFGDHTAVGGIDLTVPSGSFYGIVGPNGAGKTTTLSIVAGLLRSDSGEVVICGVDQAANPLAAKRMMGVLPDRLRTFDRLTGRQLLYYYGLLRGLASDVIEKRVGDLARAFDLGDALGRVVSDYSAGMTKKIMLAGAMIHSPRVLVLDEPFESVDPVSSAVILDILRAYVAHGGTVILSSHGMDLVERVCSRVAIIVGGDVLAEGTIDEVRAGQTLEARFVELSGGISEVEGLEWLHTFSD